jgi:protein-tyrosine phosphatase
MVCVDNISLSPLAAGLLDFAAETKGFAEHLEIDSAGLNGNQIGASPHSFSQTTAVNHGFSLTHEARQITPDDLEYFDEIMAMDESIHRDLLLLAKGPVQKEKVRLITEYDSRKDKLENIIDPTNGDLEKFEEAYEQLWYCCMGFLKRAAS